MTVISNSEGESVNLSRKKGSEKVYLYFIYGIFLIGSLFAPFSMISVIAAYILRKNKNLTVFYKSHYDLVIRLFWIYFIYIGVTLLITVALIALMFLFHVELEIISPMLEKRYILTFILLIGTLSSLEFGWLLGCVDNSAPNA